jgi:hypothetical protein
MAGWKDPQVLVAIIGVTGTILVAIITSIVAPSLVNPKSPSNQLVAPSLVNPKSPSNQLPSTA